MIHLSIFFRFASLVSERMTPLCLWNNSWYLCQNQYILQYMDMICYALFCCVYAIIHSKSMLLIYPYYHQLLHWHYKNDTIIQVLLKQLWRSPHLDYPSVWELYQPYIIWWITHSTHRGTAWCRLTAQGPISVTVYPFRTKVGIFVLILIVLIQQSCHTVAHVTIAVVECATLWHGPIILFFT